MSDLYSHKHDGAKPPRVSDCVIQSRTVTHPRRPLTAMLYIDIHGSRCCMAYTVYTNFKGL